MIVRLTPRAEKDLLFIHAYLVRRSPKGAAGVGASLEAAVQFIAAHPLAALEIKPSLFMKTLTDYPYKIFYRVRDDAVEVVHFRHAARREWRG